MNSLLDRLTISRIMSVFSFAIVIAIVINGWFLAYSAKHLARDEIELGLQDQVTAAAATIDEIILRSNYKRDVAELEIFRFMDSFRWGSDDTGYLSINDTQSNTQVYNPYKPSLNGTTTFHANLSSGETFELAIKRVARTQRPELVHYFFNDPATGEVEEKTTYIVPLVQRGWVLSSSIYVSKADHAFELVLKQLIIGVVLLIFFIALLITLITRYFSRKVGWIQNGLKQKFDESALTCDAVNEIAQIEHGIGVLFSSFNRIIKVLGDSSSCIAGAAATQQILSKNAMLGMDYQKKEMGEFATAMNEMVATVAEVANNSTSAADEIYRVKNLAISGEASMKKTADSITDLSSELAVSGSVIELL